MALPTGTITGTGELDEESVSRWLDENADVFGFETSNRPEANADPADIKNYQRIQSATNSGVSADIANDLLNRIASAETPEELRKLLDATGL